MFTAPIPKMILELKINKAFFIISYIIGSYYYIYNKLS